VLPADHYGAGTSRSRLYLIARCDGFPILWPKRTHYPNPGPGQKRWVTIGDNIDWSIPCNSIFDRKKPLAAATLARIATGIRRYCLESDSPYFASTSAVPFITECANASSQRNFSANEPLRTICAGVKGGHFALVTAFLARHFGTSIGQSLDRPCPTVMTNDKSSLVTAVLSKDDDARSYGLGDRLDPGRSLGDR
jgi:DNA (cytosine-5)-methyltransferase 1